MNSTEVNRTFYKYHGTGNDFIIIDDREETFPADNNTYIKKLCTRRFGIGADGLILLRNKSGFDFEMVYFNSDGNLGSMCGNGGRCVAAFARFIGAAGEHMKFAAADGEHTATVNGDHAEISMKDVDNIKMKGNDYILDTGSPHCIRFAEAPLNDEKLMNAVREVRFSDEFYSTGINVNIVCERDDHIEMRTYERGVENETYSCGTGVTAAALCDAVKKSKTGTLNRKVKTSGGMLKVKFNLYDGKATDIKLAGPTTLVFKGELPDDQR